MQTIGIDFATKPAKTALCAIEWSEGRARVNELRTGVTDADVRSTLQSRVPAGIDCPFGWPQAFVEAVVAHNENSRWSRWQETGELAFSRELQLRETDRQVSKALKRNPLSVSTDRIGATALRLAGLFAAADNDGVDIDRSGDGEVVEVYPAAALSRWDFDAGGYKSDKQRLVALADRLFERAHWLDLTEGHRERCRRSDDCFDALVSALVVRAATQGQTENPAENQREAARREGWIHVPTSESFDLLNKDASG